MNKIEVHNLSKEFKILKRKSGIYGALTNLFLPEYETKKAVDSLSFNIEKGEIVGFLGPNGAGKSTTIKMLVGILQPTSGSISVNGINPHKERINNTKNIGVVFGQRTQLWWDIPVIDSLNLMKYMYKIPNEKYKDNLKYYRRVLEMDEFINRPVRQLSLGQRMRADLCMSLLHEPEILYLDEPTIGLDVVVKDNIRNAISEINKQREVTVILTTHDMSDVEKLSERVMVIDKGKLVYNGNILNLRNSYGESEKLIIELKGEICSDDFAIQEIDCCNCLIEQNKIIITYNKTKVNSIQLLKRVMEKYEISNFKIQEAEIEEVIRNLYMNNM